MLDNEASCEVSPVAPYFLETTETFTSLAHPSLIYHSALMFRALIVATFAWLVIAASPPPRQAGAAIQSETERSIANSMEHIASTLQDHAESAVSNPPCDEGHDNRNSDLCAQWKAADAAKTSSGAAWLFGTLGLLLATGTLSAAAMAARYAKKAADHTERGANAARAAVEETRRIGEAQARAYLVATIFRARHLGPDGIPEIRFQIRNAGQTPAYEVRIAAQIFFCAKGIPSDQPVRFARKTNRASKSTIGAGGKIRNIVRCDGPITEERLDAIRTGKIIIGVFGVVSYRDAFGKRRLVTLKRFVGFSNLKADGTAVLSICSKGNSAN